MILRYVNSDHSHRLYAQRGELICRSLATLSREVQRRAHMGGAAAARPVPMYRSHVVHVGPPQPVAVGHRELSIIGYALKPMRNELVALESGELVVAPYGNWRKVMA